METKKQNHTSSLEIWGGIECTINRVREEYYDQSVFSGHYERKSDIDLVAGLGIKKLRYPVLWEKHQPALDTVIDWTWVTERLEAIRDAGISPIAGLLHHGSGPAFTNLEDENFPFLFAEYAKKVATQFPWIKDYTPVNEPLTTARFSGLYGFWYPHQKRDNSFLKILLNELKGTVLAMKAIREVQPDARLVQTEDLAKTYSTPLLKYQADFENKRRWLSIDILCGRLDQQHPLWNYFIENGISEESILFFVENPCPPDTIGWNYYLTSQRYIDENLDHYPQHSHGGNGHHAYADVEAVRVNFGELDGLSILLAEAWERYSLPMVITEAHLHCTREEQLRWFMHVYCSCEKALESGVDIRAVTVWSLFGAFGWNRLVRIPYGDYEPGAFDLRPGYPRPTALARFISLKTAEQEFSFPILEQEGWWESHNRFFYGPAQRQTSKKKMSQSRPLLIIGKNGTLGRAFAQMCEVRNLPYKLLSRQDCDITLQDAVNKTIEKINPWGVINAAGYVNVDKAEEEADACFNANFTGPSQLALACMNKELPFLTFSSDLVFDGKKQEPYTESDRTDPLNVYGRSKADCENEVLKIYPGALIVRTAAFFGPWDQYNFAHHIINSLESGQEIPVIKDVLVSPTYVPDLVQASLDFLIDNENGIWHIANEGSVTWADFAEMIARSFKLPVSLLKKVPLHQMRLRAPRPYNSVLKSEKGNFLPSLENALSRFIETMVKKRLAA